MKTGIWICLWVVTCSHAQAQIKTPKTITLPELMKPTARVHPDVRNAAATFTFTTTNGGADTNTISEVDFNTYTTSNCSGLASGPHSATGGSISVTNGSTWKIDSVSMYDLIDSAGQTPGTIQSVAIQVTNPPAGDIHISGDGSLCPCFSITCSGGNCLGSTVRAATLVYDIDERGCSL